MVGGEEGTVSRVLQSHAAAAAATDGTEDECRGRGRKAHLSLHLTDGGSLGESSGPTVEAGMNYAFVAYLSVSFIHSLLSTNMDFLLSTRKFLGRWETKYHSQILLSRATCQWITVTKKCK